MQADVSLDEARARDLLLTRAQVAEWLQVPVATLHGWAYKGTGPIFMKVGRYTRYRVSDVEVWLSQIPGGGGQP